MASLKQFAVDEHRGAPLRQMFAVRYTQRLATWVKTHAMVHTSVNLLFCAMRWNSTQSSTDTTLTAEQVKTSGCNPLPSRSVKPRYPAKFTSHEDFSRDGQHQSFVL